MAKAAKKAAANPQDNGTEEAPAEETLQATVISKADKVVEMAPPENANEEPWANRPRTVEEGLSPLRSHQFVRFPNSHNVFRVTAGPDHRAIDALAPEYLWGVAGEMLLQPGYIVECTNVNYDYFVELFIVRRVPESRTFQFHVMRAHEFDHSKVLKPDLSDAEIKELGGAAKFCVVRRGDILSQGHVSEMEAQAWLNRAMML
jgi:hypothetical protein